MHLPAIARAAGVLLNWEDINDLSKIIPLLARVYPNGTADVNHFHAAGGMGFVISQLLDAGLLHDDVKTIWGGSLRDYGFEPKLEADEIVWHKAPATSGDEAVLRPVSNPFSPEGGLTELSGNLGRSIAKISAVKAEHQVIEAPCVVFDDQDDFLAAFKAKSLPDHNFVCVVRFQGPKANGMPELHSLTPSLTSYLDAGKLVALVTDGRMSGASGKVAAAVHLTPEAIMGGPIARLQDGDIVRVDCQKGVIDYVGDFNAFMTRPLSPSPQAATGMGRELFTSFRAAVGTADTGGCVFFN